MNEVTKYYACDDMGWPLSFSAVGAEPVEFREDATYFDSREEIEKRMRQFCQSGWIEEKKVPSLLKPMPLALPAPAWHTRDVYNETWKHNDFSFFKWLRSKGPEELFETLEDHEQFRNAFFPASGSKYQNESGSIGRHLPHEEWMKTIDLIDHVKTAIEHEIMDRYRSELQKRADSRRKAAWTRKFNAAHKLAARPAQSSMDRRAA